MTDGNTPLEVISFTIDGLRLKNPLNSGNYVHWTKRKSDKDRVQNAVYWGARLTKTIEFPATPWAYSLVTITRFGPRRLDIDGLYASIKPVLDCLKVGRLGIIADDNPDVCHVIALQSRGRFGVQVDVEHVTKEQFDFVNRKLTPEERGGHGQRHQP